MRLIDADALEPYYRLMQDNATGMKMMALPDGVVDQQPTLDAVPVRHGKWTVTPVYIKCSECGESFMLIPQNYCPNCGARMDAE